jgi:LacI family transcriptional regulator
VAKRSGQKGATLADVAAAVGLSPAAVSLALRGKQGVSESTRDRVTEAARALGYRTPVTVTRQHAKQLTIGLVIKTVQGDSPEANRFYAPVMAGIEENCRLHRMDLMLATMPVDAQYQPLEIPRIATDRTCDGLIIVGAHLPPTMADFLEQAPPTILVDAYAEDDAFDSVATDNQGGARSAVRYLIERGHRHIAILGTEPDAYPSITQRRRGYDEVMADAGLTHRYLDAPYWHPDSAAIAGVNYLRAHPEVTAIFCANDAVGVALLQTMRQSGIRVPEEVSIIGFDDIDLAGFVSPALTTMSVDKVGMGRMAVTLLAHRLELGKIGGITQTLVRPQLVERESVLDLEHRDSGDLARLLGEARPA